MYGDFDYIEGNIKLDKIIAIAGIHGNEQWAIWSAYKFFKSLCENEMNSSELNYIKNSFEFKIIPMSNPEGVNANTRFEVSNGGDPNRNFPQSSRDIHQVIDTFAEDNSDALYFFDIHNNWYNTTPKDDLSKHIVTSATIEDVSLKNIVAGVYSSLSHEWINRYPHVKQKVDDYTGSTGKQYPFGFITPHINTTIASGVENRHGITSTLLELQADNVFNENFGRNDNTIAEMGVDVITNVMLSLAENN